MIGFNTSLEGLSRSEAQFNQAAQQIALAPVTPGGEDTVSLSDAAVQLLQAKNNFDANTKAIKVQDQMTQALFNAIG
jgi:Flagellar basal body rod FlgEFG protein C-terminal